MGFLRDRRERQALVRLQLAKDPTVMIPLNVEDFAAYCARFWRGALPGENERRQERVDFYRQETGAAALSFAALEKSCAGNLQRLVWNTYQLKSGNKKMEVMTQGDATLIEEIFQRTCRERMRSLAVQELPSGAPVPAPTGWDAGVAARALLVVLDRAGPAVSRFREVQEKMKAWADAEQAAGRWEFTPENPVSESARNPYREEFRESFEEMTARLKQIQAAEDDIFVHAGVSPSKNKEEYWEWVARKARVKPG